MTETIENNFHLFLKKKNENINFENQNHTQQRQRKTCSKQNSNHG